jgi:hypothetical protein
MNDVLEKERVIVQEKPFQRNWTHEYLDQLLDTLPQINSHNPSNPEWRETPLIKLDLNNYGSKKRNVRVLVKNEADRTSNPEGLLKNRMAHEVEPVFYRHVAEHLWRQKLNGQLHLIPLPLQTMCTAGNAGMVLAKAAEKYGLPPVKLLLDIHTPSNILEALKKSRADIYLAPLDRNVFTGKDEPYSPLQLRILTNNNTGFDTTSSHSPINPFKDYYDWHWHEIFNKQPSRVYGPFGTGDWFSNGITWQRETVYNGETRKDPRLTADISRVTDISILAAEPELQTSLARKLTGLKPFLYYTENDITAMKLSRFTGKDTGVYKISEDYLKEGFNILSHVVETSYDGSSGMALLVKDFDEGKLKPGETYIAVNTGRGLV